MAWRRSIWRVIADWFSFQIGTIEERLLPRPEREEDRAIREAGERLRHKFPEQYRHERSARAYRKHYRAVLAGKAANDR